MLVCVCVEGVSVLVCVCGRSECAGVCVWRGMSVHVCVPVSSKA